MSFETFATMADLEDRWRTLECNERNQAQIKIYDASALIAQVLKKSGIKIDEDDDVQKQSLISVCCSVVKRAMLANTDELPASSTTQMAGAYQRTISYVNPGGDIYLTASEKKALGGGLQKIGNVGHFEESEDANDN